VIVRLEVTAALWEVVVGSLHPHQPGVSQVVVELVVDEVVVVGSLQPNQPGFDLISLDL
jgi:hypothetical protein